MKEKRFISGNKMTNEIKTAIAEIKEKRKFNKFGSDLEGRMFVIKKVRSKGEKTLGYIHLPKEFIAKKMLVFELTQYEAIIIRSNIHAAIFIENLFKQLNYGGQIK